MSKVFKDKVRKKIVADYGNLVSKENIDLQELQDAISRVVEEVARREPQGLTEQDKKRIIQELIDEVGGLGPLEGLLKDPNITEIMINGPQKIYIERSGKREVSSIKFDDEAQLMYLIYKVLAPTRRHVDETTPYTEVTLRDGSRANIVIPPISLDGPSITIRKFMKEIKSVEDLMKLGTLDKRMADFLVSCIKAKVNIIFSGATGAGKTTTLNVLSSYIGNDERVVTIEDTAELQLSQEHVVRLEARQASIEGKGEVSIRDIFKNSLRMRPDRIVLGEIRGAEALDMLQAICSGHAGSLAVLHANSPHDVISRLEMMILTSGVPLNLEVVHRQIATTLQLIVQQEQLIDGSRKITHITQVSGMKKGQIVLEDIFVYDMHNIDEHGIVAGSWRATGIVPGFYEAFRKEGVVLPKEIFSEG